MIVRVELSHDVRFVKCVRHRGDVLVMLFVVVWCFGTLVGVFVFSVMWSRVADDICY